MHAGTSVFSGAAEPTRTVVSPWSVEPISPILPSCVEQWQSTGSFPSPVGDRDHSTCRHRITHELGKAHRETRSCSGGRATPALGLAASIRDVICKSRRILRLLQTRRPRTPGLARPSPCSLFPRLWNHRNRSCPPPAMGRRGRTDSARRPAASSKVLLRAPASHGRPIETTRCSRSDRARCATVYWIHPTGPCQLPGRFPMSGLAFCNLGYPRTPPPQSDACFTLFFKEH